MAIRLFICISFFSLSFCTLASAQTNDDYDSEGNFQYGIEDRYGYLDDFRGAFSAAMDGGSGFELLPSGERWGETHEEEEQSPIDCQELIYRLYIHYAEDSASSLNDVEILLHYYCVGD